MLLYGYPLVGHRLASIPVLGIQNPNLPHILEGARQHLQVTLSRPVVHGIEDLKILTIREFELLIIETNFL